MSPRYVLNTKAKIVIFSRKNPAEATFQYVEINITNNKISAL